MRALVICLVSAATVGCQASPGFRVSGEFLMPPTLRTASTLTPLPALPTTAYAVDAVGPIPMSQRQYYLAPAATMPAIPSNTPAGPVRQLLPMPRESAPPIPQPCQPGQCQE